MNQTQKILSIVILLVGVFGLNWIASMAKNVRVDTTSAKIYSLTPGTQELLNEIEGDIEFDFYFSRSNVRISDEQYIEISNFADRALALLRQFDNNYKGENGDITIDVIDPKPDTEEADKAEEAEFSFKDNLDNTMFQAGIQIAFEGNVENIDFIREGESFLERKIILTLHKLANEGPDKPVIGIVNPELSRMEEHTPFFERLREIYEIESIAKDAKSLPDKDLEAIIVVHPRGVTDALVYELDQYLMDGGNLMVCVDPVCWSDRYVNPLPSNMPNFGGMMPQMPSYPDGDSDLEKLFETWGVEYDKSKVLLDYTTQNTMNKVGEYPAWFRLQGEEQIVGENLHKSGINLLLVMESGYFDLGSGSDLNLEKLVVSSKETELVDAGAIRDTMTQQLYRQFPLDWFYVHPSMVMNSKKQVQVLNAKKDKDSDGEAYTIAGRLTGNFKTAFADGKPEDSENESEQKKDSGGKGEVVIFTDVDMLFGYFQRYSSKINDQMRPVMARNTPLLVNEVDRLVHGDESILDDIWIKGEALRSFEIKDKLEAERQKKINEENQKFDKEQLDAIEAKKKKIEEIQQKLQTEMASTVQTQRQTVAKLQQELAPYRQHIRMTPQGLTIRTDDPEAAKRISKLLEDMNKIQSEIANAEKQANEKLNAEITKINKETKKKEDEIERKKKGARRTGREEIETLETKIQLANLIPVPLLVTIAGICFFVTRRKRN